MQLPESAVQDLFGCKSGLELMGIGCISQVTAAAVDGITYHTVLDYVCYAEGPPFPTKSLSSCQARSAEMKAAATSIMRATGPNAVQVAAATVCIAS